MGMYSEVIKCDLSLKYVWAVAEEFGLPRPREDEHKGHAMHFRADDIRKWYDRAEEHLRHDMCDPHLFHIATVLRTHALDYLNVAMRNAPNSGMKRKNYLRKATRRYRFLFL